MKIGILTLYHNNHNYGGQLQAYALQKYLSNMGNEVELIDYNQYPESIVDLWLDRVYRNCRILLNPVKIAQAKADSSKSFENKKKYRELLRKNNLGAASSEKKFEDFAKNIPHTKCFDRHSINSISDYYDAVVLGGDQIWNPDNFSKAYFAFWEKNKQKVLTYSASAGKDNFQSYELRRIKKLLSKISSISVREENFCKILKNILNREDIENVLDPVFLLNKDEWENIAIAPKIDQKYIFAYLLNRDINSRREITLYAQKCGVKIITIPHGRGEYNFCDEGFGDIVRYDVGPLEFLGIIKDAEVVFTDSFHGTCFSIILNKEFYVISNMVDNTNKTTNARLHTVLSMLGLMERMINVSNFRSYQGQIDYTDVEYELHIQKEKSKNWLHKALQQIRE